ncbi:MAG TPA: flagellar motor protein MotA [Hyphomicrobiaceae bacterium]|nr:flagellar motor protein MotA [Hyphomicrobiaceae bacterium]
MAKTRQTTGATTVVHRTLSSPRRALLNMTLFLVLIGMLAALLVPQLKAAFLTNPFLNGLIVCVFAFGILYAFGQVLRLYPEIRWVNAFRIADPGLSSGSPPRLLAPMATMLRDRTGTLSLSATSMRSIMDSIGARLDEARDTGRYLVGLLVFLGLLGTFWGLLDTITQVGNTISSLDTKAAESSMVFEELKQGLAAPLRGMGTAFSASLLGLSGSLILGFLELQANHAQSRFYNELEEWLSGITELTPSGAGADQINRQLLVALGDMQGVLSALSQRLGVEGPLPQSPVDDTVRSLAVGVDQLVRQMRAEQKVVREWVDEQSAQQSEVALALKELAQNIKSTNR